MSNIITAGVILIENTKKPSVIQTEKSQVKRKEWEKQNKCDMVWCTRGWDKKLVNVTFLRVFTMSDL